MLGHGCRNQTSWYLATFGHHDNIGEQKSWLVQEKVKRGGLVRVVWLNYYYSATRFCVYPTTTLKIKPYSSYFPNWKSGLILEECRCEAGREVRISRIHFLSVLGQEWGGDLQLCRSGLQPAHQHILKDTSWRHLVIVDLLGLTVAHLARWRPGHWGLLCWWSSQASALLRWGKSQGVPQTVTSPDLRVEGH